MQVCLSMTFAHAAELIVNNTWQDAISICSTMLWELTRRAWGGDAVCPSGALGITAELDWPFFVLEIGRHSNQEILQAFLRLNAFLPTVAWAHPFHVACLNNSRLSTDVCTKGGSRSALSALLRVLKAHR